MGVTTTWSPVLTVPMTGPLWLISGGVPMYGDSAVLTGAVSPIPLASDPTPVLHFCARGGTMPAMWPTRDACLARPEREQCAVAAWPLAASAAGTPVATSASEDSRTAIPRDTRMLVVRPLMWVVPGARRPFSQQSHVF